MKLSPFFKRYITKFKVVYVDPKVMEDCAALHHLTTLGRKLSIPNNEIWIARDLKKYTRFLVVHEGVEEYLRSQGDNYKDSHRKAELVEDELFSGDPLYEHYRENV